jgi:hypothetical protein
MFISKFVIANANEILRILTLEDVLKVISCDFNCIVTPHYPPLQRGETRKIRFPPLVKGRVREG